MLLDSSDLSNPREIIGAHFYYAPYVDGFSTFMFSRICAGIINWTRLTQGLQCSIHVLRMCVLEILIFYS